jgi:hypothetical protein
MAELIDELLPDSFLQRCIGGFLDMLADIAASDASVSMTLAGRRHKVYHVLPEQRLRVVSSLCAR